MSNFITKAEVKSIAFERSISDSLIPDDFITLAEHEHLRPAIGNDFYDRLDQDNGNLTAYEVTLKGHLKKALAFWVKYECLPHIYMQLDNSGLKISEASYSENVSNAQLRDFRAATLETARKLYTIADRYMYDNDTNLPYWTQSASLTRRTSTNDGGIIIPARRVTKDDPYAG